MGSAIRDITGARDFPEGMSWTRRPFESGEVLIREGDRDECLYIVEKGHLRVTDSVALEGQRVIQPGICDLGPGDLFGELCLFDSQPRSASVVAISDGELLEISAPHLHAWMDQHPDVGYRVLKELFDIQIQRLRRANRRVCGLLAWGLKVHGIDEYL